VIQYREICSRFSFGKKQFKRDTIFGNTAVEFHSARSSSKGYNIGNTALDFNSLRNSSKRHNIGNTAVEFHSVKSVKRAHYRKYCCRFSFGKKAVQRDTISGKLL
jgi:hypothetical protein